MEDLKQAFADIVRRINLTPDEGDYEQAGLLYCGKCRTPRQKAMTFQDEQTIVPVLCSCRSEARRLEDERIAQKEFEQRVQSARRAAIADEELRGWTFEADDGKNRKLTDAMRRYADDFKTMKEKNIGLLLYGDVGSGKTFYAACIVNAVVQAGYKALMTSFVRIVNGIPSGFDDEKQEYFNSFQKFDLLVIDDLGAERSSDYMLENVYNIIDSRYRSGKPLIVTSNIDLETINKTTDMRYARIYDRILELCHPILVPGGSRRKEVARNRYKEMNGLLGL